MLYQAEPRADAESVNLGNRSLCGKLYGHFRALSGGFDATWCRVLAWGNCRKEGRTFLGLLAEAGIDRAVDWTDADDVVHWRGVVGQEASADDDVARCGDCHCADGARIYN